MRFWLSLFILRNANLEKMLKTLKIYKADFLIYAKKGELFYEFSFILNTLYC